MQAEARGVPEPLPTTFAQLQPPRPPVQGIVRLSDLADPAALLAVGDMLEAWANRRAWRPPRDCSERDRFILQSRYSSLQRWTSPAAGELTPEDKLVLAALGNLQCLLHTRSSPVCDRIIAATGWGQALTVSLARWQRDGLTAGPGQSPPPPPRDRSAGAPEPSAAPPRDGPPAHRHGLPVTPPPDAAEPRTPTRGRLNTPITKDAVQCICGAVFAPASWHNHRSDIRKQVQQGQVAGNHPCLTISQPDGLPTWDAEFRTARREGRWADARDRACVLKRGCRVADRELWWDTSVQGLRLAAASGLQLPVRRSEWLPLRAAASSTEPARRSVPPPATAVEGVVPTRRVQPGPASAAVPPLSDSSPGSDGERSTPSPFAAGPLRSPSSRGGGGAGGGGGGGPRRPPPTSDPTLSPEVDDLLASGRPKHRARTARSQPSACVSIDSDDGEDGGGCARVAAQPVMVPVASIRARLEPLPAALAQASRVRDFPPDSAALGPAWFYGVAAAMAEAAINNSITPTADVYAEYSLISAHFHLFPDFVAHFAADSVAREISLTAVQQLPDDDTEAWALLFHPAPGPLQDGTLALHYAAHGPCTMPTGLLAAATTFLDRCYEQVYAAAAVASSSPSPTPEPAPVAPVRTPRPPALASVRPPAPPSPSPTPSPEAPKPGAPDSGSSESSSSEGSEQPPP